MNRSVPVAIALGSNLGDRDAHFDFAIERLSALLTNFTVSSRHDTAPVDVVGEQPRFLNAAAIGRTALAPAALLDALLAIELARGRERPHLRAPRTLDLDLVLYGEEIVSTIDLHVPHPRFRERRFVLAPLAEIAPGWRDPVTKRTVAELLALLPPAPPEVHP